MTLKQLMRDSRAWLGGSGRLMRRYYALEQQGENFRRPAAPGNGLPYHSQVGQDRFLNEKIFHGQRGGVFVDIGAYDGVEFSNTCFFEQELGWTGVCVEPDPAVYQRLAKNRRCTCVNVGVADFNGTAKFLHFDGAEMFNGLAGSLSPKQKRRIEADAATHGAGRELQVPCVKADDLFRDQKLGRIDYLSIDAEGMDFAILKSIDLGRVDIRVISIENNHRAFGYQIMEQLDRRGYDLAGVVGDEIYVKRGAGE